MTGFARHHVCIISLPYWTSVIPCCILAKVGEQKNGKRYIPLEEVPLSYSEAREACGKINGHLPVPLNEEDNEIIWSFQTIKKNNNDPSIWLGISDAEQEGRQEK